MAKSKDKADNAKRKLTLGEMRKRAADLRVQKLSYAQVAKLMDISAVKARDLCLQYQRYAHLRPPHSWRFELSAPAILALLTCDHASQVGNDVNVRMRHLPQIAASYTKLELLKSEPIRKGLVVEIETWLASKRLRFRSRKVPATEALTALTATQRQERAWEVSAVNPERSSMAHDLFVSASDPGAPTPESDLRTGVTPAPIA